jgi:hypothetical protein
MLIELNHTGRAAVLCEAVVVFESSTAEQEQEQQQLSDHAPGIHIEGLVEPWRAGLVPPIVLRGSRCRCNTKTAPVGEQPKCRVDALTDAGTQGRSHGQQMMTCQARPVALRSLPSDGHSK